MMGQVNDVPDALVQATVGEFDILLSLAPPPTLGVYQRHAELADDFTSGDDDPDDGYLFVAINDGCEWPRLVITQRFAPAVPGFTPGVLLVPEQRQLFVGAGTRLVAYQARTGDWRRSWIDEAECGFWGWRRHDDVVLMSAELELAAWTTGGEKLWTTFVEPPWSYEVTAGQVVLDVMGTASRFDLRTGPYSPAC